MDASDLIRVRGVVTSDFPQVTFSLGNAPEYPPYEASGIWQK